MGTEHGEPLVTDLLDEGAIPSTSTTCIANWLFDDEELEVERYRYENAQLVLIP